MTVLWREAGASCCSPCCLFYSLPDTSSHLPGPLHTLPGPIPGYRLSQGRKLVCPLWLELLPQHACLQGQGHRSALGAQPRCWGQVTSNSWSCKEVFAACPGLGVGARHGLRSTEHDPFRIPIGNCMHSHPSLAQGLEVPSWCLVRAGRNGTAPWTPGGTSSSYAPGRPNLGTGEHSWFQKTWGAQQVSRS